MLDNELVKEFIRKELHIDAWAETGSAGWINPKYTAYHTYVHVSGNGRWVHVLPMEHEHKRFAFPFRAIGINTLKISGRTINDWRDLPTPNDGLNSLILENCKLPPLGDIPQYGYITIEIDPTVKTSIVEMFNKSMQFKQSIDFKVMMNHSCWLRIFKMQSGYCSIATNYAMGNDVLIEDAFDLQNNLIEFGFEHLL